MSDSASISERARQLADRILAGEQFGVGESDGLMQSIKEHKKIIIGGGIAVLVIAALGGAAYYMKKDKKS